MRRLLLRFDGKVVTCEVQVVPEPLRRMLRHLFSRTWFFAGAEISDLQMRGPRFCFQPASRR
ncbi:hypothetical protein COMA2_30136 [Candidatus Nitrospira nitrificans]|uniref:Uncharacterized protein n=1 Tax=Candidatus Nitrospira nitrificans TaxID=1742973 RepID=A0A0S4LKE0_9BACT|nr:hypothetical protein COMA2_30136 [Candidatus Nitrospira nitrificans]